MAFTMQLSAEKSDFLCENPMESKAREDFIVANRNLAIRRWETCQETNLPWRDTSHATAVTLSITNGLIYPLVI